MLLPSHFCSQISVFPLNTNSIFSWIHDQSEFYYKESRLFMNVWVLWLSDIMVLCFLDGEKAERLSSSYIFPYVRHAREEARVVLVTEKLPFEW